MKLNIFFIHATGLKDREKVISELQKQVQKYHFKNIRSVKIKVITEYDPNEINGEFIQRAVNYSPIKDADELKEENKTLSLSFYNQFLKNMHLFQLSNALKHYKALEYVANSAEDELNIILEDDVVYEEKVCGFKKNEDRPIFSKMLEEIEKGNIEKIIDLGAKSHWSRSYPILTKHSTPNR